MEALRFVARLVWALWCGFLAVCGQSDRHTLADSGCHDQVRAFDE